MHDPEFGHISVEYVKATAKRGRAREVLIFVAIILAPWLVLGSITTRRLTCAACRLDRIDRGIFGLAWSSHEESEFSQWYAANVERTHKHVWARHGYCRTTLFVTACYRGAPITRIAKASQMKAYQRFDDPMVAKQLFLQLAKWGGGDWRLQEGLTEWIRTDSTESWDVWWPKHREE